MYYLESLHHARKTIEFFHFCRQKLNDGPYELLESIAESSYSPMFGITNAANQIEFCKLMCSECNEETTDEEFITWALQSHPRVRKPLIQWMDRGRLMTGVSSASVKAKLEERARVEGRDEASIIEFLAENHAMWTRIKEGKIKTPEQMKHFVNTRFPPSGFKNTVHDSREEFFIAFIENIVNGTIPEPAATPDGVDEWLNAIINMQEMAKRGEAIRAVEQLRDAMKNKAEASDHMQELTDVASKVIQFHESRKDLLKP